MREDIKNWIQIKLAILYGQSFSLNKKFRKGGAVAVIHFVEGGDNTGGSIKIEMNGITYFFEGTPKIEEYKNAEGKNVIRKELKYGGWEMDMEHPNNKLPLFK
jgi:hypothetical protein